VAETTCFGPRRLLDGSLGCSGVAVGDGLEFVGAGPHTRSSPPHGYEVLLSEEPVRATVLGERALTVDRIAEGVRLSLREGGRAARLVTQRGQTPRDVAAALQAAAREAGLALAVEATGDGRLLVQHRLFGSAYRFAVGSSLPGVLSTPQGAPRVVSNGRDIAGTMNGEPAWGDGQTLTGCFGNPTTDGLVVRYTGLPFTGATGRLRHSRPSVLKPRVFAGRVVVAQQALVFRLGGAPAEQINLRLDSVRPQHLARGVANASGFAALADVRVTGSVALRDALLMVAQARAEVETGLEALRKLAHGTLTEALGRLRVQSQNVAASVPDLHAPDAALHAVQALSLAIVREARTALSAQAHPPQGSLLELLDDDETTHPGPRWN